MKILDKQFIFMVRLNYIDLIPVHLLDPLSTHLLVVDPECLPELPAHLLLVLLDQELGRQLDELWELQAPGSVLVNLLHDLLQFKYQSSLMYQSGKSSLVSSGLRARLRETRNRSGALSALDLIVGARRKPVHIWQQTKEWECDKKIFVGLGK